MRSYKKKKRQILFHVRCTFVRDDITDIEIQHIWHTVSGLIVIHKVCARGIEERVGAEFIRTGVGRQVLVKAVR